MTAKNSDRRCKGRTKHGKRCRAAATAGGLCFFHANPNKAVELGRLGGKSKGPAAGEALEPLPKLHTAMAIREIVARLIDDVLSGKVQPRIASTLTPLLNLQLRVVETSDMESRLAKVEKVVAQIGFGDPEARGVAGLPRHNFESAGGSAIEDEASIARRAAE